MTLSESPQWPNQTTLRWEAQMKITLIFWNLFLLFCKVRKEVMHIFSAFLKFNEAILALLTIILWLFRINKDYTESFSSIDLSYLIFRSKIKEICIVMQLIIQRPAYGHNSLCLFSSFLVILLFSNNKNLWIESVCIFSCDWSISFIRYRNLNNENS